MSVTMLIILGGLGFTVIADIYRYPRHRLSLHSKMVLVFTAFLLTVGTLLFLALEWSNTLAHLTPAGKIMASYFQSVTTRTAGFNTLDIAELNGASQLLTIMLMFIGASPVSTGGGIKTMTFLVLVLAVWSFVAGKEDAEVFDRRIPKFQIYKALAIMFLFVNMIIVVTLLLVITEKADFLTVFFETVSAFGTVGLSMGLTTELTPYGKVLIIMTMFFGRLGPLTVAFALAQRRRRRMYRLPEETIIVG